MTRLAHHVFFTLNDRSDESIETLIAACQKHLTNHPGLVDFSVGRRAKDLDREVNGDFDVSLHCIFDCRENHDLYQDAPRHHEFIEATRSMWANVLVMDSELCDASS